MKHIGKKEALTELYKSLLRSLIMRYLGDHPDHIYKRLSLETLNDLPLIPS